MRVGLTDTPVRRRRWTRRPNPPISRLVPAHPRLQLTVNGRPVAADAPGQQSLLDFLRDTCDLTGTKRGCDRGECGACTVLVDGAPTLSCLALAHGCAGQSVQTVEGLGDVQAPHALQEAFAAEDAAQCGFCTPGQLMAAAALLAREADPSETAVRAALSGNLCRCGTHPKIVRAVRRAAQHLREAGTASDDGTTRETTARAPEASRA